MKELSYEQLNVLCEEYGDAFYLLDSEQFLQNYLELKEAFSCIYPEFNIAYSYKTNYTPKLCRIVDSQGGYAEVVSDMEMEIALKCGVKPEKIIWNGPYKNPKAVEKLLLMGGTVNLDCVSEVDVVRAIAQKYPEHTLNVGIRCNFEINDDTVSRFGFDVDTEDFDTALQFVQGTANIHLAGMQCHFATRNLETWPSRVTGMLELLDKLQLVPEHIDLGGGLFGKMADSLKEQFGTYIPNYKEYAEAVATLLAKKYENAPKKPLLLIEPGSALVGDCMKFVSRVTNIKSVRGKYIATLLGSIYNINPTLNKKNPPIEIYKCQKAHETYKDLDFGGYTCIESDYLYRHFNGELAVGDLVVLGNAGSYSVVLKPPFILPNFPMLDICDGKVEVIKRQETFEDLFSTFNFR